MSNELQQTIEELRQQVETQQAEIARLKADGDAARGCPHGEDCACALGSRHSWLEAFSKERTRAEQAEAAITALREHWTWRGIESAPEGIEDVLVHVTLGGTFIAHRNRRSGWSTVPGTWTVHPTHWLPLPAGPTPERERSG